MRSSPNEVWLPGDMDTVEDSGTKGRSSCSCSPLCSCSQGTSHPFSYCSYLTSWLSTLWPNLGEVSQCIHSTGEVSARQKMHTGRPVHTVRWCNTHFLRKVGWKENSSLLFRPSCSLFLLLCLKVMVA